MRSVLEHYAETNPSRRDPADWPLLHARHVRLYRDRLHLPRRLFAGARMLDVGCGTGEFSAIYATWGASVDLVDGNPDALTHARAVFAEHDLTPGVVTCADLTTWTPAGSYDLVISQGVLHHLHNPRAVCARLAAAVALEGFLVLSVNPSPGHEIRQAMRTHIQAATSTLTEAVRLAQSWYPTFLAKATQRGRRTVEQVVSDNLLTPIDTALPVLDVLGWVQQAGLTVYRSWPTLEPVSIAPPSEPVAWTADHLAAQTARWFDDAEAVRLYDGIGQWWIVASR